MSFNGGYVHSYCFHTRNGTVEGVNLYTEWGTLSVCQHKREFALKPQLIRNVGCSTLESQNSFATKANMGKG